MPRKKLLFFLILLIGSQKQYAQYTLNGNATRDACNEYSLTQAVNWLGGSVWNNNKIDLSQSFDFNFDIFLGNSDAGADGIAFVLQPISTSVGSAGGGLGYSGITPAVGITIDTGKIPVPATPPMTISRFSSTAISIIAILIVSPGR
ncbi:MAG: hypothetical protein IPL84_18040 [Chitinophagaceae bacterium]|nr:hypothetical protein [Chitinophagaceae bacterium]